MEERLKKYNWNKARIEELKGIKLKNEEKYYTITGGNLEPTGIKPKGFVKSGAETKIIKKSDEEVDIDKELKYLTQEIKIVDTALNILNPLERQVVELYYIRNLSKCAVASTVGVTEKHVYKIRKRAISKMILN